MLAFKRKRKKKGIVRNGLVLWLDGKDFKNSPPTSSWLDKSGNNNNATPSNFAYTISSGSDNNGGVVFDGIDDKILTPITVPNNTSFSLEYTIKNPSRVVASTEITLDTYSSSNLTGFGFIRRTTGFEISSRNDNNTIPSYTILSNAYNTQNILTIGVSCDYATGICKIYKDGFYIAQITGMNFIHSTPLKISGGNQTLFSKDNMKNFKYYNRVLSDQEFLKNYNATR